MKPAIITRSLAPTFNRVEIFPSVAGLGVGVGVAGVGVTVDVGVGVGVGEGVGVDVGAGEGVGVVLVSNCGQYLPPSLNRAPDAVPPQTIISRPVQTAE